MRFADSREGAGADSKTWQIPYEAGGLFWSLFGVFYSWRTEGRNLRLRCAGL
jgi:hypothetical protein